LHIYKFVLVTVTGVDAEYVAADVQVILSTDNCMVKPPMAVIFVTVIVAKRRVFANVNVRVCVLFPELCHLVETFPSLTFAIGYEVLVDVAITIAVAARFVSEWTLVKLTKQHTNKNSFLIIIIVLFLKNGFYCSELCFGHDRILFLNMAVPIISCTFLMVI
jgi:hypothetical protein